MPDQDSVRIQGQENALQSTRPNVLREAPGAPPGPSVAHAPTPTQIEPELEAELEAEEKKGWVTRFNLSPWFEDRRLSAIRQAVPALAVGAALAVQRGAGYPTYVLGLAVVGVLLPLVAVRKIPRVFDRRKSNAIGPEDAGPQAAATAAKPSNRDTRILIVAAGSLAALAVLGGLPVVYLYLAAAVFGAMLIPGGVSPGWQSQVETTARLGLSSVVVGIVFLAQGGAWSMDIVVAGVQLGLAATVLEILHAMRDRGRDLKAGRKTLVVRYGIPFGEIQLALICLLPFTMNICWLLAGAWPAALLTLLAVPLAAWLIRDVMGSVAGPILDRYRPKAAALHLAFAVLLVIAFVI
jgi:1,4-dihydroxy-2-naphthoate octaprenyltransferase